MRVSAMARGIGLSRARLAVGGHQILVSLPTVTSRYISYLAVVGHEVLVHGEEVALAVVRERERREQQVVLPRELLEQPHLVGR